MRAPQRDVAASRREHRGDGARDPGAHDAGRRMVPRNRQPARRRKMTTALTPRGGQRRYPPEPESLTQQNDATSRGLPSARGAAALRILASSRNLFAGQAFVDTPDRQIK